MEFKKCPICKERHPPAKIFRWDAEVMRGFKEHNEKRICSECFGILKDKLYNEREAIRKKEILENAICN